MENLKEHKIYKIEDLIEFDESTVKTQILSKNGDFASIIVAMKKDQIFKEHISPVNAYVYVIEGRVFFRVNNDGNISEFELNKGEIFTFLANEKHSLVALKDSKFLVVRI